MIFINNFFKNIPQRPQCCLFQAHTQQLVFPKGKYQIPAVLVYTSKHPNNWYFRGAPNTRSIRIFRQKPNTLYSKGEYQIPAVFVYSGIDQTLGISEGKHQIPAVFVYSGNDQTLAAVDP